MYQFCYISESTSDKSILLEDLRNILAEARDFNYRHQVSGALYFAEGYFFQCLEGDKEVLQSLIDKLKKDPRHTNIKLFEFKQINEAVFADWSMKYISRRDEIHQCCQRMGFDAFKPYEFEQKHVDTLLEILKHQNESENEQNVA